MKIHRLAAFCGLVAGLTACGSYEPLIGDTVLITAPDSIMVPVYNDPFDAARQQLASITDSVVATIADRRLSGVKGKGNHFQIMTKSGRAISGWIEISDNQPVKIQKWTQGSPLPVPHYPNPQEILASKTSLIGGEPTWDHAYPIDVVNLFAMTTMLGQLSCDRDFLMNTVNSSTKGEYETTNDFEVRKAAQLRAGLDSLVGIASMRCGLDLATGCLFETRVPIARVERYDPDRQKMELVSSPAILGGVLSTCEQIGITLADTPMYDTVFPNCDIITYKDGHNRSYTTLRRENDVLVGMWHFFGPGYRPEIMKRFAEVVNSGEVTAKVRVQVSFSDAFLAANIVRVTFVDSKDTPLVYWQTRDVPIQYSGSPERIYKEIRAEGWDRTLVD